MFPIKVPWYPALSLVTEWWRQLASIIRNCNTFPIGAPAVLRSPLWIAQEKHSQRPGPGEQQQLVCHCSLRRCLRRPPNRRSGVPRKSVRNAPKSANTEDGMTSGTKLLVFQCERAILQQVFEFYCIPCMCCYRSRTIRRNRLTLFTCLTLALKTDVRNLADGISDEILLFGNFTDSFKFLLWLQEGFEIFRPHVSLTRWIELSRQLNLVDSQVCTLAMLELCTLTMRRFASWRHNHFLVMRTIIARGDPNTCLIHNLSWRHKI